jgi:hypothetical protein
MPRNILLALADTVRMEVAIAKSGSNCGYSGTRLYHITYHGMHKEECSWGIVCRGYIQAHSIRSSELLSRTQP